MIQERVEDPLTRAGKSPLTLLHQRGVKPPLPKGGQGDLESAYKALGENEYERHGDTCRRFLQSQASAEGP